jgi:hypothetical protein
MALAEVQALLARVFTDEAVRERLFAEPATLATEYGLTSDELSQLEALSVRQVRFAATGLRHKRLNAVSRLLPFTQAALGDRFGPLFMRHAAAYAPSGIRKHRDDALAFATFVERLARWEPFAPPAAPDQLRYEAAWLRTADANPCLIVRRFQHPVRTWGGVGRDLRAFGLLGIALWVRFSPGGPLRHLLLAL